MTTIKHLNLTIEVPEGSIVEIDGDNVKVSRKKDKPEPEKEKQSARDRLKDFADYYSRIPKPEPQTPGIVPDLIWCNAQYSNADAVADRTRDQLRKYSK